MRTRIAVLASGKGSNLQAILDFLDAQGEARSADVVLVISDRATAFALERARGHAIEVRIINHSDHESLLSALTSCDIDLVVLAGYLRRLPAPVIERFHQRILNVHPAPLPRFGGAGMYGIRVHEAVLEAGIPETAITIHLVDEEYDRGGIVAQWPVPVYENDTASTLAARVLEVEHQLYPRLIDAVASLLTLNTVQTN